MLTRSIAVMNITHDVLYTRGRRSYSARPSQGVPRSGPCPSVIVDVPALVDFQHRLEFAVYDNIRDLHECRSEMDLDARVALLHQVEARPATRVRGQIETEEGVPVTKVGASQAVLFVLRHFAGRDEQVNVTSDVMILEEFGGYLSTIHVDSEEVYVVMFGVKRIFSVQPVVRVVVDTTQHRSFGGCRGKGACATWPRAGWSTLCSRRGAADTWSYPSRVP